MPVAKSYELANAEDRAREHPTFEIPSLAKRRRMKVGMLVKLVFLGTDERKRRAERMWVKITKVTNISTMDCIEYEGTLENDPVTFEEDELERGAVISFGPEHITEWDVSEP